MKIGYGQCLRKPWLSCKNHHPKLSRYWIQAKSAVDDGMVSNDQIENTAKDVFSHELHPSQYRELKKVILDDAVFHISANRIKYRIANLIVDRFDKKSANQNYVVIDNISKWEKKQLKKAHVFYCNESERADYQVWIKNNFFLNHNNQKIISDDYIFVLNKDLNELYIGKKRIESRGALQHSSFLAGSAVSSAGYIRLEQGKNQTIVHDIKMSSGHYRPSKQEAYVILKYLAFHNVDLSRTTIFKPYKKNTLKSKLYYALVDVARRNDRLGRISRLVIDRARKERLLTGVDYIRYFEGRYGDFAQRVENKINLTNRIDVGHLSGGIIPAPASPIFAA